LFYHYYYVLGEENQPVVDRLCQEYAKINDRESERGFLRRAEPILSPLALTKWKLSDHEKRETFEDYWKEHTSIWRSVKRHTSSFSFPFIRAGIDIYSAFAFDVGPEDDPVWYSNVYYHY
ncbi:MAG: hypothetical protein OEM04_12015, partial [Flavobacteriaceae bacterium]|nr:hypothetical protein [Flavobacteriaceae bacterium]